MSFRYRFTMSFDPSTLTAAAYAGVILTAGLAAAVNSIAAIQLFSAIYGGYFGAGIGVLMLAGLSFASLDHLHQMNALQVLLATLINGTATIIFISRSALPQTPPQDRIHWPLALGMVL